MLYSLLLLSDTRCVKLIGFPQHVLEPLAEEARRNKFTSWAICIQPDNASHIDENDEFSHIVTLEYLDCESRLVSVAFIEDRDELVREAFLSNNKMCFLPCRTWEEAKPICRQIMEVGTPAEFKMLT